MLQRERSPLFEIQLESTTLSPYRRQRFTPNVCVCVLLSAVRAVQA